MQLSSIPTVTIQRSAAIKIQARVRGHQLRNKQLRNKQLLEAAESGDIYEVIAPTQDKKWKGKEIQDNTPNGIFFMEV